MIRNLEVWAPQTKSSSRKGQRFGARAKVLQKEREEQALIEAQAAAESPEVISTFGARRTPDYQNDENNNNNQGKSERKDPHTNRIAILQGVTATFMPSCVTAILGPGGSGKTTLMNALLARLPKGWTREGYVAVNGDYSHDVTGRLRGVTGSATQTEPLHRELTVYQNLYYAPSSAAEGLVIKR